MAALHSALQILSPTSFESVPTAESEAKDYLKDIFSKARLIIDSVPPPPVDGSLAGVRSRANTSASDVSGTSEVSTSSVRSDPFDPANTMFQKEWGRAIKLSAKDNPLGMAVYKAAGRDGRGAWFARRSVHEGMGFKKWKMGLQKEFPESMEVQGGPGEGNVRGIGGERRVESISVNGLGMIEVYHLSAQFPGPTTPRDFVTLLITSSSALEPPQNLSLPSTANSRSSQFDPHPRHYMVISKPCLHPECPPRDGFIRGQYESVEFIREIPIRPKRTFSTTQLLKHGHARANSLSPDGANPLITAQNISSSNKEDETGLDNAQCDENPRPSLDYNLSSRGRKRGRTISFAESRGISAKGEAVDTLQDDSDDVAETNPVEWVMVTRSDPGGSVPRFLVERGTPSGIVTDASKFLNWAFNKEYLDLNDEMKNTSEATAQDRKTPTSEHELEAYQTNGHLAGVNGPFDLDEGSPPDKKPSESQGTMHNRSAGLLTSMTNMAYSGIETYAPQIVINQLPNHRVTPSTAGSMASGSNRNVSSTIVPTDNPGEASPSSSSSVASFASAEERFDDHFSHESPTPLLKSSSTTDMTDMTPQERELKKLNDRKRALDEKLARLREKELKDKEEITSREEERLRKAEEKHAREVQKQEQKYKKEVAKLEAKRARDTAKEEERRRKAEDKDEKARLVREKEELKQQLEVAQKERDILSEQVGALQRENTALVAKMGKLGDGQDHLKDIRMELSGGSRSRSGSLRKPRSTISSLASESTIVSSEKKEPNN